MRALVTGGAKRLGREMALYLAIRGFDVIVHYNSSASEAEDVAAEIRSQGRKSGAIKADLLDESHVLELVPEAVKQLGGPLTLLVNNASIFEYDTVPSATRESWDRHIESNLRAPFVLTQHFADQAPEIKYDENDEPRASASIVNIIDQRVRKLTPEFSSYSIAKMGLWALTQISAQGLAPKVRVNAIGPGPTLQGSRQSKDHFNKQRSSTILGRGANPFDILAALGYFIDSPAVTGQLLCIDGGQHLCWQTPDVLGVE
jgi:NAD(P)-dependent dehydrogenase (short-subunit alcohol dehydrogenase family)